MKEFRSDLSGKTYNMLTAISFQCNKNSHSFGCSVAPAARKKFFAATKSFTAVQYLVVVFKRIE